MMNVLLPLLTGIQVIALFATIAMYDVINRTVLLIFVLAAINTFFCIIVMLGQASRVYPASVRVINKFRKRIVLSRHGTNRRMNKRIGSLRPMKIKFFSGNFFDQLTPLNIERFCIDTTVSLLLLNPS